jgi:hypothetical protein
MRRAYKIFVGKPQGRDRIGDVGVNGRVILK